MFVTVDSLATQYGVHDDIGQFFVDRKVPENNLYWHKKLLFVTNNPGYLFIPVIVDTLNRLKIPRATMLNEEYASLLEQIGHIASLEEIKKITQEEAVEQCIQLTKHKVKHEFFYNTLINFMQGETENFITPLCMPFSALHRGDIFLFSLAVLDFDNETAIKIVQDWFAIIGAFLLLDDSEDIQQDKELEGNNAFIQAGLNQEGLDKIKLFVTEIITQLKTFNKTLARTTEQMLLPMFTNPNVLKHINQ